VQSHAREILDGRHPGTSPKFETGWKMEWRFIPFGPHQIGANAKGQKDWPTHTSEPYDIHTLYESQMSQRVTETNDGRVKKLVADNEYLFSDAGSTGFTCESTTPPLKTQCRHSNTYAEPAFSHT